MAAMRLWAILAAAAFVAMTGSEPRPSAPKATPPAGTPSAPPCPADELSCGLQRPVFSDGVRSFSNENYGVRMTFPRGSAVCMTRSGDAPHGFFAVYGADAGCSERPERPPRFISLYAEFNALFERSLAAVVPETCGPLLESVRQRIGAKPLAFPNWRSVTCQEPSDADSIEIAVYTLAGPWQSSGEQPESRSRAVVYFAALGSTPAHIEEDLARFRVVLASIEIRSVR